MKDFRFSLAKVLEWRQTELELREFQHKRCAAEIAAVDEAREALKTAAAQAENQLRSGKPVEASELWALGGFRQQVKKKDRALAARRSELLKKLEDERIRVLEARRRCRLLERLAERRRKEWEAERDREIEEAAAESYLARWVRRKA